MGLAKPTNGFYILIKEYPSNDISHIIGPSRSMRDIEKAERGLNRQLNHERYYTESAWFGPDIEPNEVTT